MATNVKGSTLVVVVLALIIANYATPAKGVTCNDAVMSLVPCQGYLMGSQDISIPCCMGAASLRDLAAAASQEDRKTICECFKSTGQAMGVNLDRAKGLPQLCNLNINFSIDASVDCTKI